MTTTPNVNNVKMGACSVKWGGNDLGYTMGGVDVAIKTNTKPVNVDQFGDSVIDEFIMGRTVQITVPMAESDLQKLALAIPGSTLVIDGQTPTKMMLQVNVNQGQSLRALAQALILHPTANLPTDLSGDFLVPIASPSGNMDFAYTYDKERVYKVTFMGYPDNTTGELFVFGDPTSNANDATILTVASGAYVSASGIVTLTLSAAAPAWLTPEAMINVANLTGTGSFASLDGTYEVISVEGATVSYQGPTGLTVTITGGQVTV